jgi:hypothetical protein
LSDESPSIIDEMGLAAEEREQIWARLDDLKKRAAETDRRIAEDEEETARLIERLERLQRRLLRYC